MRDVVRVWLGSAALAAGLVHIALALGAAPAAAVVLVVLGAAELLWGVFCFPAPRIPLPRAAAVGAVVPIVAWVAALLAGAPLVDGIRLFPMLAACLLDLVVALGVALVLRRPAADADPPGGEAPSGAARPGGARVVLGMAAGTVLIGALALPALAATEAGEAVGDGRPFPLPGHIGH